MMVRFIGRTIAVNTIMRLVCRGVLDAKDAPHTRGSDRYLGATNALSLGSLGTPRGSTVLYPLAQDRQTGDLK